MLFPVGKNSISRPDGDMSGMGHEMIKVSRVKGRIVSFISDLIFTEYQAQVVMKALKYVYTDRCGKREMKVPQMEETHMEDRH